AVLIAGGVGVVVLEGDALVPGRGQCPVRPQPVAAVAALGSTVAVEDLRLGQVDRRLRSAAVPEHRLHGRGGSERDTGTAAGLVLDRRVVVGAVDGAEIEGGRCGGGGRGGLCRALVVGGQFRPRRDAEADATLVLFHRG